MSDACCFLDNAAVLINVVQPFTNLDESHILIAFESRAVYITIAAFTVITLSIPTIKCESDSLTGLVKKALEILAGDFRVDDYRVRFYIEDDIIKVIKIGPRGDIYGN